MPGRLAALFLSAAIAIVVCGAASAQRTIWPVDFEHSFAALALNSSNGIPPSIYPGVAKVAGFAKVDPKDPANSSFELNIYPARQEATVLNPDGTFRVDSLADLSRYTLMLFQSKNTTTDPDGHLAMAGDLTVTHVEREASGSWNSAYTGAQPIEPRKELHTRQLIFTVENTVSELQKQALAGYLRISARAVIGREDFPGLWTWLRDSIWPIVVEDEHCEIPPITTGSMRDYKGATCVGNLIENPLRDLQPTQNQTPRPGAVPSHSPAGDRITILLHIQIREPG